MQFVPVRGANRAVHGVGVGMQDSICCKLGMTGNMYILYL